MVRVSPEAVALVDTPPRWGDLRRRLLSTAVLVPPILGAILIGGVVWTATVAVLVALLGWEWARLCRSPGARLRERPKAVGIPGSGAMFGGASLGGKPGAAVGVAPAGSPSLHRGVAAFWLPLGLVWIGLAGTAMLWLRLDPTVGLANTLFLGLVVAATDVGAYAFGRIVRGPRLAPAISPNKTWAGAMGGLLSAMAVGGAAGYALLPPPTGAGFGAMPVAAALAILAMAGDLFESWIKRRCDVKDTSGLLPGHGGLLDRLDGLIAAAPLAALWAHAAGPAAPLWAMP